VNFRNISSGTQSLPPVFSLGYHQCRWNYRDEADVDAVHAKFDEHDIPVDVVWLDIEHTNGKRYFTWDNGFFPNPAAMQQRLAGKGRKMVTIVDPHIKVDDGFSVYKEAKDAGYYVMRGSDKSQIANGHCWSGDSAYLDFSNPAVRQYWAKQFTVYPGATEHLFTWNDMNEPSVFNGPEISMPRDNIHFGDVEHRENHNMYGFFMTMATHAGHLEAYPNRRPFILSRSFFAGSQRHVAIWTGDNDASWEHLQASIPMVLAHNMAGLPFAGADTGGFFRNPEPELLVRWYQTAAWHPFFRGHAHLETKRREPWLFGEDNTNRIRAAIRRRYDMMPYLYTLFHESSVTGAPIARPLYYEFPYDTSLVREEKLFMLGHALLISPIVTPGVASVETSLPVASNW
jgi:mannosyl-oligosaccharide alpha-1,3-glucosidase